MNRSIFTIRSAGGPGTPGGLDTEVQFNDGGAFAGSDKLVFNKTTGQVSVTGPIKMVDGNQALNKVITSAADGVGSWQALPTKSLVVERTPEPTGFDFNQDSLTKDSAWHELSLASIIPEGTKFVILRIDIKNQNVVGAYVSVRKNGYTSGYANVVCRAQVANVDLHYTGQVCPVSADRKIDYIVENSGTWSVIGIVVCAWIL